MGLVLMIDQPVEERIMPEGVKPWYVVVERMDHDFNDLPAYKVGPFATEEEAAEEGQGEASHTAWLLVEDAKSEDYIAHECYWTQEPPDGPTFGPLIEMRPNAEAK